MKIIKKSALFVLLFTTIIVLSGCGSDESKPTFTPDPQYSNERSGRRWRWFGSGDDNFRQMRWDRNVMWMSGNMMSGDMIRWFGSGNFGSGDMRRQTRWMIPNLDELSSKLDEEGKLIVKQIQNAQKNEDFETVRSLFDDLRKKYPELMSWSMAR